MLRPVARLLESGTCRSPRSRTAQIVMFTQARNVRTRVDTKVKLRKREQVQAGGRVHNQEADIQSMKELPKDEEIIRTGSSTTSKRRPSKFDGRGKLASDAGAISQSIMNSLQFKTPEQIAAELKDQFVRDGIDIDDDFINNMIEQSKKEQELVHDYLRNPGDTLSKVNEDEIIRYIDWIVQDGFERVQYQHEDILRRKMELREKLNAFTTEKHDDGDPESMTNAFIMAQEMAKLNSRSALDVLPEFLRQISKINNSEFQKSIPLAKYAKLYELSTQLIDPKYRELCIYLCGKLLYDALLREYGARARPDPINEKFFIESCLQYEDFNRAVELFESRKEKDVKDERFWLELGVSAYLARYSHFTSDSIDGTNEDQGGEEKEDVDGEAVNEDLNKAIGLVQQISDRWGYVNNIQLIDGLKKCCARSNFSDALWFWEELEINMAEVGIAPQIKIPTTRMYDENEKEKVFNYYNRIEKASYDGLSECIFAFIGRLQFETSMEMICKVLTFDQQFIVAFVQKLGAQFSFSGRELFLIELEKDVARDPQSARYNIDVRDYLIEEIKKFQPRRCSSADEAKILEDTQVYLERLSKMKKRKNNSRVNDLLEILESGEMLSSFNVKSLLNVLLEHKSSTSFQIAARTLSQMNIHKMNDIRNSILPIANSEAYTEFCSQFLSQSNPRVNEIKQLLLMMEQFEIPLSPKLANDIIMAYNFKKLFSEAVSFINEYIFSDNPIAIKKIELNSSTSISSLKAKEENLYTAVLITFYKSVVTGMLSKEIFALRLNSLQDFIKQMMASNFDDDFTFQEAIGTLLAYGDYQTAICFVQWYGAKKKDQKLCLQLVLALKSKLELSLLQAEKYLLEENPMQSNIKRITDYRRQFGIQSLQNDLKSQRDYPWQEVAKVIYNYADLFGFKSTYSKEDPFAIILSDQARNVNRNTFDQELSRLQRFYDLSEWSP